MATRGVLTLVSQGAHDGSAAPGNAEQGTPCEFTLDESALTWQPTEGSSAGERNGRFVLLDALTIARETPETFTLACDDGERFTIQAPSEGECTMWFKAISRGIHEAKGEEEEEENEDDGDFKEEKEEEKEESETNNSEENLDIGCNQFIYFIFIYFLFYFLKHHTMTFMYRS